MTKADTMHSAVAPWIGFDLDGTLAKQYWPHAGEFHPLIIGEPTPLVDLAKHLIASGHTVKVFTARVGPRGNSPNNRGVKLRDVHKAIGDWTEKHIGIRLEATCVKDFNMIELYDDRAHHVIHNEGALRARTAPKTLPGESFDARPGGDERS